MADLQKQNNSSPKNDGVLFRLFSLTKFPDLSTQLIFWLLIIVGVAADLWTKAAVFNLIDRQGRITIIDGFFQFVQVQNPGAAFGIAVGQRPFLIAASILALVAIFIVFLFSGNEHKILYISLGLFSAGVCGNLYDRIFNDGLVRDFIDIVYWPGRHWPAFNVADSMLCVSVGLMIISNLFIESHHSQKHSQQHK